MPWRRLHGEDPQPGTKITNFGHGARPSEAAVACMVAMGTGRKTRAANCSVDILNRVARLENSPFVAAAVMAAVCVGMVLRGRGS